MSDQIIGLAPGLATSLDPWLAAGQGLAVRDWMGQRYHLAVADIFGYHALQLGAQTFNSLANSRIAHRWCAVDGLMQPANAHGVTLYATASALPFFEATLDLVSLPLTLDLHSDPETVLDEAVRVLVPEGKLVLTGLNPMSLWGLAHGFFPQGSKAYGHKNLSQALSERGFLIERMEFGGYSLPGTAKQHLPTPGWMEQAATRWWPQWGGMYFVVARKRVMGVKPRRRVAWRLPKWSDLPLNPFPSPDPGRARKK